MFDEFCKDPMKVCLFWAVVLVLLILVLLKLWGMLNGKEKQSNREYRQQNPFTSGATQRFAQDHETPYLQNCIEYVYEMKADADRKTIADGTDAAQNAAQNALADAAAVATANTNANVANAAAAEYLVSSRGYGSTDAVHDKWLGHHENMSPAAAGLMPPGSHMRKEHLGSGREGPMHWFIGDNIQELKNEVSGQSPDLDTNRWTMQLQNQVSDLRSDTVEGNLAEDILFRRSVANM